MLCEENEKIRCFPLFSVVELEKVALPPANFWQLVAGLASLVVLCLEREREGPEAEKGVVKGSVERQERDGFTR